MSIRERVIREQLTTDLSEHERRFAALFRAYLSAVEASEVTRRQLWLDGKLPEAENTDSWAEPRSARATTLPWTG